MRAIITPSTSKLPCLDVQICMYMYAYVCMDGLFQLNSMEASVSFTAVLGFLYRHNHNHNYNYHISFPAATAAVDVSIIHDVIYVCNGRMRM